MKKFLFICFGLTTYISVAQTTAYRLSAELQNFTAVCNQEKIETNWQTTSRIDNVTFTIEKSKDGVNFTKVVDVPCVAKDEVDYVAADSKPYEGTSYYRLKESDNTNGSYKYSLIVTVAFTGKKSITVYPNPLLNAANLRVNLSGLENQEVLVVVRNMQGTVVVSKNMVTNESNETFVIEGTNSLPAGNYFVTALGSDKTYNYEIVVK